MRFKRICVVMALTLLATACAPTGRTDGCAGWRPITGLARDADVISDTLALSIAEHQEQGRALGCWG
ncbi:MAG: hypothetical protein CSA72_10635 [Rhodobacterales bacterium]|nr:MAG: hypothetical protein CSA72_10635 [Rhodobacterales bacterium]